MMMTRFSKETFAAFIFSTATLLGASGTTAQADTAAPPASKSVACEASVVRAGGPDEAAKAVAFAPPALETRYLVNNGYYQVASVDGMTVTTVNASNRTYTWLAGMIYAPNAMDKASVEAIWPLEIGKRVTFLERSGKDAWCHTIDTLRAESIDVPAGSFETIVLEEQIKSVEPAQGNLDVRRTYWYAPAAHWTVKKEVKQIAGPPFASEPYLLNQIVAVSSRPPTIDRHWAKMACSDAPIDLPFSQTRDCYRGPIGKGDDGQCHAERYGTAGGDGTLGFEIYLTLAGGRCGIYFAGDDVQEFAQSATAMSRNGLDFSPLKRIESVEVLSFTGRGQKGPLGCFAFARIGPTLRRTENLYRYTLRGHVCREDGTTFSDSDIAALVRGISVE
jgi:hypothetical protein